MKKFNFLENLLRREFAMSGMRGMRGMNGLRADAVNSDSQPTVNRQSRLTSVQRHDSVTSARVAREWLNGSTHLRVWPLKIVAVLAILLTIGIGNVWGTDPAIDDVIFKEEWGGNNIQASAYTFTGTTTWSGSTTGLSYSSTSNQSLLSTATAGGITTPNFFFVKTSASTLTMGGIAIPSNVTDITVSFASNKTIINCTYSFDNSSYSTGATSINGTQTFDIDCDGESTLYLKFTKTGTSSNARLDDIIITVKAVSSGGANYTVTYSANGGSGDAMANSTGASITISTNTYTAPAGKEFSSWNTAANGSGTTYTEGQTGVTADLNLYAQWTCITPTISGHPSNGSCVQDGSPSALTVTASGGTLSYQWKQSATSGGTYTNVSSGTGGTTASYTPPVTTTGTTYYKCVVTNTGSSCNTTATSNAASFTVTEPAAAATVTLENYSGSDPTGLHVGDSYTLPSSNSFTCGTKTFVGWSSVSIANSASKPGSNYYEPGQSVTISSASMTFYAVFATGTPGSPVEHAGPSFSRSGTTNSTTSGYTFTAAAEAKTGYYQDGSGTLRSLKLYHTSTAIFSSTPSRVVLTAVIGGGTAKDPLGNSVMAQLLDKDGNGIGNATTVTSKITTAGGDEYNIDLDLTGITSAYGVMIYHTKESSYNVRYYSFSLTYYTGGGTTYSNYTTTCAAVDPTATFSNGSYTIGGSALDLRTLWTSNSTGAVTYSVYNANGTGATIAGDGYSLSATTAGTCTVRASQAAVTGVYNAITKDATITVNPPTCATPTFNNGTGTYNNDVSVTISCATGSSTIHYTTGASPADPTCSSGSIGTSVTINATGTILKAVACRDGYNVSSVASATYTLQCATPTFSVAAGTYSSAQTVSLSCTTDNATIKYTTDGTDPATYGTNYSTPISVSADMTIKAIATKTNYVASEEASATYRIRDCDWYESFDTNDGTDGCTGSTAAGPFKSDHDGWTSDNKYGGAGYARFGKTNTASAATTPTITGLRGNLTLKFRARAWTGEGGDMSLSVTSGTLNKTSVTIAACEWDDYEATISGVTADFTITFQGPTRYFLDEVCIKEGTPTYKVTYNANSANSGSVPVDNTEYDYNGSVTVLGNPNNLAKTGWTLAGWNTAADGSGTTYTAGNTFNITSNTTLYAKWTCTVTWSVNENTSAYTPETVTYNPSGSKVTIVPTPDPEDYCGDKFVGWYTTDYDDDDTAPTGTFKNVEGSPDINDTGSTTFYAVFADFAE